MNRKLMVGMAALAMLLAFAAGVQAQEAGERSFDVVAGLYVPGIDDLDNDLTFGVGWRSRVGEQFGWGLYAGYLDLNQNNTDLAPRIGSANGYFVDADVTWYIAGSDFGLFGGIGFGSVDIDLNGTTRDESDDAFTYNYGVNYTWNFGESYLLRPQIKWRKWDGDTYEKTDEEYTMAFGWRF